MNTLEWIETQISQHKEAIKVLEADRQVLRGVARMASATDRVTTSDNGHAGSTETARTVRRRGRPAKVPASISSGAGEAPRASRGRLDGPSLGERVLADVGNRPGADKSEIVKLLAPALPMHVGTALSRHSKAGRLVEHDGRYSLPG